MTDTGVFAIGEKIRVIPVIHGSGSFARVVRQRLLSSPCDCLAVALPPEFQSTVEQGIDYLPILTASCQMETGGVLNMVPIDPCQPLITGIRIARQEGVPRAYIDWSTRCFETRKVAFPDPLALKWLSLEKFDSSLMLFQNPPAPDSQHDKRARWMGYQLHRLELDYKNIVLICSVVDWPWIKDAYDERKSYSPPEPPDSAPRLHALNPGTLFFALTEFPYVTYLYEKNRIEMRSDKDVEVDGVKEILLRARENFIDRHKVRYHNLTSQSFQIFLQYVRNLTLLEGRLTPDLYTLVCAAKQIGGDAFGISVLEAAREYPYQETEQTGLEPLSLGIDKAIVDEQEGHAASAKNRLNETQFEWRTLDLKPQPDIKKREDWKYNWNPHGQCSWPPEDEKIENLNSHVREQSRWLLSHDLARSEKFTSSVKDGLDIRETLRHWYSGDLYVKVIPPSRGKVEIVVFLFDPEPDPNVYKWKQTWYSEHENESTLCFFATEYLNNMVGPGIGQSCYGGCMTIFPPRTIPNIWEDPRIHIAETLDEKLLEAAFFHSFERHVTVVSPCLPTLGWRRLARQYKKHIIHIPLKRFSNQTIEKVRRFHVLNGKEVRSFAQRFIQDI